MRVLAALLILWAGPAAGQGLTPSGTDGLAEVDDAAIIPGTATSKIEVPVTDDIEWQWPLYGRVSSQFGWRKDPKGRGRRMHTGIDIAAAPGRTVRAAGPGKVHFAGRAAAYGLMVVIAHPDGHRTRYAHLNALWVKRGAQLEGGDPIGVVGNTGRSTGPHLHFELREGGRPIDPAVIAIGFAQPLDAEAKQKGPVLRVPGLPKHAMGQALKGLLDRVHGVSSMFWHWWAR